MPSTVSSVSLVFIQLFSETLLSCLKWKKNLEGNLNSIYSTFCIFMMCIKCTLATYQVDFGK